MTILVDPCRWPWRGRLWCHMVSDDSYAELHEFAPGLGLPRRAFQGDHYDIDEGLREAALARGAVAVDSRVLVRRLRAAGLRAGPRQPVPPAAALPPLAPESVPLVLARYHAMVPVGTALEFDEPVHGPLPPEVFAGAGFTAAGDDRWMRARTLPDTVGPGMRLLVCGLNPSVVAADAGYGFAGATNRFWKAALAAGVTDRAADPVRALLLHGVGMTDLVKRATPRSAEVTRDEYVAGVARVRTLVAWLRPAAVCFVGLEGWRTAVDRRAGVGWQDGGLAGVPAYVMPSTSGLNARVALAELVGHLEAAQAGPG